MKRDIFKNKSIIIIAFLFVLVFVFSGCTSQQEENGVSLLPQDHQTAKEMQNDMGIPLY